MKTITKKHITKETVTLVRARQKTGATLLAEMDAGRYVESITVTKNQKAKHRPGAGSAIGCVIGLHSFGASAFCLQVSGSYPPPQLVALLPALSQLAAEDPLTANVLQAIKSPVCGQELEGLFSSSWSIWYDVGCSRIWTGKGDVAHFVP